MIQRRENVTPLFWAELTFKRYEDAMIFSVLIFSLRLDPTVREQVDENNFRYYYGIFLESTNLNLLDHISKFFRNNYKTLWQRHLKGTLQLKILRT